MDRARRDFVKTVGLGAVAASLGGAACAAPGGMGPALAPMKDGQYVLPELPYVHDALEPHIDARTVGLHHDRHHQGYVNGLNGALSALEAARRAGDFSAVKAHTRALSFHGSGHVLHSLYWQSMSPNGGGLPGGELGRMAREQFGSPAALKEQFVAATGAVEASGWGVLAYEPVGGRLLVLQAEKHQDLAVWGAVPLLVCDAWEHAYYLKYQNRRGLYLENFMEVVNWETAERRLEVARQGT